LNEPTDIYSRGPLLGIDESGKGDFFGPLVIAGVMADESQAAVLAEKGVRDSKKMADSRIKSLARWIMANFVHSVVLIGPRKYNELYRKIGNLNKLLAWGHSRVIENVAAENTIGLAISDQFGRADFIEKTLMEKGRRIELRQIVRAETIIPVAAGSIVARAAFVNFLDKMSQQYHMTFPKGAGGPVDEAAFSLASRHGMPVLEETAKIHFKNFQKVLNKRGARSR